MTLNDDPPRAAQLPRVREAWVERSGSKDTPAVEAVCPEAVLGQVVGGPRVMFLRCDYAESDQQVDQVRLRFAALVDLSLGEGESMELIAEVAADL